MEVLKVGFGSGATSGCVGVLAEFESVSTEDQDEVGSSLDRPRRRLGICRALWGRLDDSQFGRWYAGFQKPVTIMGDVSRSFPSEIPQVPFDGQTWIARQQDFGGFCRFLGPSRLRQRRRAYGEHVEIIGIQIQ